MAAALVALVDQLPQGEVALAAVVDEEMGRSCQRPGLRADGAIVELTGNRLALGHKGLGVARSRVSAALRGGTP
jgi:hypothetical protein